MSNPVTRFQILSKNPEKSAEFYTGVFGWTVDANNAMGYREINTGSDRGIAGGIWPSPPEGKDFVQLFIEVDDIDAVVTSITRSGGNIIMPPQTLPDGDRMAIALDPLGVAFGLWMRRTKE